MNRRIRIILLTVSLLLVVGTLGWLTHVLLIQAEETGRSERRIKVESLAHEAKLEMDRLLTAFITFEQARGYYEYLPFYAYKRPYDQRMDAPAPGEPARSSNLASYLPDYVTAYLQISPSGQVTGPALNKELSERLNREKNLYQRLNEKVSALISLPASGNLWADIRNEILHEVPEPEPPQDGVPAQVETVSSFVPVEDGGNLYILRQVHTNRGVYLQGALMNMESLNRRLPEQVAKALPQSRLATFDPAAPPAEEAGREGTLFFANAPLVFLPGNAAELPVQDHKQMLTWTLTLIWSMVLVGAAGVIWLMLGTFRLEQRRGDFVSAVTHELRTPLTSFSLYTEMLEDGMVPEQKKPEYYANMQRECRRLEHLIDNVLAYSKLQRNAIRRTKDTLTCQELFEPIAEKIERRLREAGISFSFALAQPIRILPVHTDAVAVEQIMDNLTSNAIKYARGENAKVQLTVQADRHNIVIRFRDNGPGISPKHRKLVFKPFRRTKEAHQQPEARRGPGAFPGAGHRPLPGRGPETGVRYAGGRQLSADPPQVLNFTGKRRCPGDRSIS